jgi:hypothetical protein
MSHYFSSPFVVPRRFVAALKTTKLVVKLRKTRSTVPFRLVVAAILATFVLAGAGIAQEPSDYQTVVPGPYHPIVPPYPVEFGFSQDHSSTALEGALRGKAAVIQAWGNFELSDSQARILDQQTRWLSRENDLAQTEALLIQKKLWSDARIEERKEREARVAEGKISQAQRRSTLHREAYRLSPSELDLATGQIIWPVLLQAEEFRFERQQVEDLFREHVSYGTPLREKSREISRLVDKLVRSLRSEIAAVPRGDYMTAQKFLRGLKVEAEALVTG